MITWRVISIPQWHHQLHNLSVCHYQCQLSKCYSESTCCGKDRWTEMPYLCSDLFLNTAVWLRLFGSHVSVWLRLFGSHPKGTFVSGLLSFIHPIWAKLLLRGRWEEQFEAQLIWNCSGLNFSIYALIRVEQRMNSVNFQMYSINPASQGLWAASKQMAPKFVQLQFMLVINPWKATHFIKKDEGNHAFEAALNVNTSCCKSTRKSRDNLGTLGNSPMCHR